MTGIHASTRGRYTHPMSTRKSSVFDLKLDQPPRSRRWIPLSLRLFVAMMALMFVGGALWVGVAMYREQVTVAEIERVGGLVEFTNGGPDWLRRQIGNQRMKPFDNVCTVQLVKKDGVDSILPQLNRLPKLRRLNIALSDVSDAGMSHVAALSTLENLDIHHTRITDKGVGYLEGLPNLQVLDLRWTLVTDTGLARLKGIPKLRDLDLGNTKLTDAAIPEIVRIPNLQRINLGATGITDAALGQLKNAPGLQRLGLSGTAISNIGLEQLQSLLTLREISLNGTRVTEAGASKLKSSLPALTYIEGSPFWNLRTAVRRPSRTELLRGEP
jgi:Leucine rich repeat